MSTYLSCQKRKSVFMLNVCNSVWLCIQVLLCNISFRFFIFSLPDFWTEPPEDGFIVDQYEIKNIETIKKLYCTYFSKNLK